MLQNVQIMMSANNSMGSRQKPVNPNQNIQVYVRVRPTNARERAIRSCEVVEVPNGKEVIARQYLDAKTTKKFTFDKAFDPDSRQVGVSLFIGISLENQNRLCFNSSAKSILRLLHH